MIIFTLPGDVIALAGGQEEHQSWLRMAAEKYCKFAYSSRYGFGVETDFRQFDCASFDNMLAFSDDGRHFRVRECNQEARIAENLIYARWCPYSDVIVETWSLPAAPWHIRIHRINSPGSYRIIEGGFAVSRPDGGPGGATEEDAGIGSIVTATDFSGIRDLGSTVARTGRALKASPNSNLINAKTTVPQLLGEIQSGETILFTAILALGNPNAGQAAWNRLPRVPQLIDLEEIIRSKGSEVTMNLKRYRCNALEKL
jgi:hypothetical protein